MPKEQGLPTLEQLRQKEVKLQESLVKADTVELTFLSHNYVTRLEKAIEKTPEKVCSKHT